MRFKVCHRTQYEYHQPVSESVGELRMRPVDDDLQRCLEYSLSIHPESTAPRSFRDFFGNTVECFSVPFRHSALIIECHSVVDTGLVVPHDRQLETTLGEARQILRSSPAETLLYLGASRLVNAVRVSGITGFGVVRASVPIGEAISGINRWIHANFRYNSGATDVETPLEQVLERREGVCQDFAHVFLAIARGLGLPARYVSGYVESRVPGEDKDSHIGGMASHAWVEVMLPGGLWWGLDPTNNCVAGERHVKVAVGRDYSDVPPVRGTFRGGGSHQLAVEVTLGRC